MDKVDKTLSHSFLRNIVRTNKSSDSLPDSTTAFSGFIRTSGKSGIPEVLFV